MESPDSEGSIDCAPVIHTRPNPNRPDPASEDHSGKLIPTPPTTSRTVELAKTIVLAFPALIDEVNQKVILEHILQVLNNRTQKWDNLKTTNEITRGIPLAIGEEAHELFEIKVLDILNRDQESQALQLIANDPRGNPPNERIEAEAAENKQQDGEKLTNKSKFDRSKDK